MNIDFRNIECIINHYYEALYRYCYRILRSKEDAEDLVQEVFIKINNLLEDKKNIEIHNNYLYKIAYNKCINTIRRKKIIKFISFEGSGVEDLYYKKDTYFEDELSEELSKIMSLLKVEERSLLILRTIEEMSYEEISKIVGKTPSTLRKQYERIKKKVIRLIEKEDIENVKTSFI